MSLILEHQKPVDRMKKSLKIQRKLFRLNEFKKSKNIFFYVSMQNEVNTLPMIDRVLKEGKKVFVPLCDAGKTKLHFYEIKSRKDLKKGSFGILEPPAEEKKPADLKKIDCVIVPGLAFDKENNRLGRGKGYYDGFLKKLPKRTKKIGLGFSFQVVEKLPIEDHDQQLDFVLTD